MIQQVQTLQKNLYVFLRSPPWRCTLLLKGLWRNKPYRSEKNVEKIILSRNKISIQENCTMNRHLKNKFFSQLFFTVLKGISTIYRWEHKYLNILFDMPSAHWPPDLLYRLQPLLMQVNVLSAWHTQSYRTVPNNLGLYWPLTWCSISGHCIFQTDFLWSSFTLSFRKPIVTMVSLGHPGV